MKLGIPCIASSKFFLLSFGGLLDAGTFLYTLLQSFYHLFKCCSLYSGYSPKFRNFVFEYPDIFSYFVSPNFNSIFHFRKRFYSKDDFYEQMMKILVINCSPVRNGATAEIVSIVKKCVEKENTVDTVCIDDFEIKLCKGCRKCNEIAECFQEDDVVKLMKKYDWADRIVSVSPSYWADVPGQFKVFIDRCTPWCNTHVPHAKLASGKKGYVIALRTGSSMLECERVISSIEHFYGHLEIEPCGKLGLCGVEFKENLNGRLEEIKTFCELIKSP